MTQTTQTPASYSTLNKKPKKLYILKGDTVKSRNIVAVQNNNELLNTKTRDEYRICTGTQTLYSQNTPFKKIFI